MMISETCRVRFCTQYPMGLCFFRQVRNSATSVFCTFWSQRYSCSLVLYTFFYFYRSDWRDVVFSPSGAAFMPVLLFSSSLLAARSTILLSSFLLGIAFRQRYSSLLLNTYRFISRESGYQLDGIFIKILIYMALKFFPIYFPYILAEVCGPFSVGYCIPL